MKEEVIYRLKSFIEDEARSCSMDFGCVTPEYVYRMWGGTVALDEIEIAFSEIKKRSHIKIEAPISDGSLYGSMFNGLATSSKFHG